MKIKINVALLVILAVIASLAVGANSKGAPNLVYVYSNSMEPLIKVNDAFIIWPASKWQPGDIVMYRPLVLKAEYITHRVIQINESGFITKGDNSPFSDQDSGEPLISKNQIIGKVLSIGGQPIILPQLGILSQMVQKSWSQYVKFISIAFFFLAGLNIMLGRKHHYRKLKSRRRRRLKDLYKGLAFGAAAVVILGILIGARVSSIQYFVSEYPTNPNEHVEVGKAGTLTLEVQNNGLIPVWSIPSGIKPLASSSQAVWIGLLDSQEIKIHVEPQEKIGSYKGYVQVYNYPALLPKMLITDLHRINPSLAIAVMGAVVGSITLLTVRIIGKLVGLQPWMPVKAIRDKMADRKMQRIKMKIMKGRRARI